MRTLQIENYYASTKHLLDLFCKESRKMGFKASNVKEFDNWKQSLRDKLSMITGLYKMEKCELKPTIIESVVLEGYRRDKIILQTEPDIWMPLYALIPNDLKEGERRACIIAPHGHDSAGKFSTSGRNDIPSVKDMIKKYNYDYGLEFVRRGYIIFCPDARGFGERREWTKQKDDEESFLTSTCTQLNNMAICLGQSVSGMWTWDLMRLIDYIESRKDCDAQKLCCAGLSGGGNQTLWLSAMDDRVKCAVVSGYFYGYKDALLKLSDNCSCNYVPHLWEYIDMCDLGALIAPRPLLIESGSKDPLNGERGLINVTEQVEITRSAYKLFNAEDKLYHYTFDGEHKWDGKETYSFVRKHLY